MPGLTPYLTAAMTACLTVSKNTEPTPRLWHVYLQRSVMLPATWNTVSSHWEQIEIQSPWLHMGLGKLEKLGKQEVWLILPERVENTLVPLVCRYQFTDIKTGETCVSELLFTHKHKQPSFDEKWSSHLWDYQPGVKMKSDLVRQWKETKVKFAIDALEFIWKVRASVDYHTERSTHTLDCPRLHRKKKAKDVKLQVVTCSRLSSFINVLKQQRWRKDEDDEFLTVETNSSIKNWPFLPQPAAKISLNANWHKIIYK